MLVTPLFALWLSAATVLPKNQILIKGAEPAASDSSTALPEQGRVVEGRYLNDYFGLSYPVPAGWREQPSGPPPSDSGSYVLAQFALFGPDGKRVLAHVLVTAQDLFFSARPVASAGELTRAFAANLAPEYAVERAPADVTIAGRPFTRFGYGAAAAGLHWRMLSTDARCHALTFTLTGSSDVALDAAERALSGITFDSDAEVPRCVAFYAFDHVMSREEPHFSVRRFNTMPVRVVIGSDGLVKHVHVLAAFPEQSQAILTALRAWRFQPYLQDGKALPVETGIVFGSVRPASPSH